MATLIQVSCLFLACAVSLRRGEALAPCRNHARQQFGFKVLSLGNNNGNYLDNLSSSDDSPKSTNAKKQASYPKRSLEQETNPMMAARSYLDRLNGPPPSDDDDVASTKIEAPNMGSYLDQLTDDSVADASP